MKQHFKVFFTRLCQFTVSTPFSRGRTAIERGRVTTVEEMIDTSILQSNYKTMSVPIALKGLGDVGGTGSGSSVASS